MENKILKIKKETGILLILIKKKLLTLFLKPSLLLNKAMERKQKRFLIKL